jgi:hypothetical protein
MLISGQKEPTHFQAKGIIPRQQLQARAAPVIGAFAVIFSKENLVLGGSRIAAFFDLEQNFFEGKFGSRGEPDCCFFRP